MSIIWARTSAYAFPPIAMIPRVLDKLSRSSQCKLMLIAPHWPRQLWFPHLMSAEPFYLPQRRGLILNPDKTHLPLTTIKTLNLTVWQLSSSPTKRQASLQRLQPWQERQGVLQPERLIMSASESTEDCVGTSKGLLIQPLRGQ